MNDSIKFGGTYLCSKCGMHHNSSGCPKDIMSELAEVKSSSDDNVHLLGFTLTPEEVIIVNHFLTCDKNKLEKEEKSLENDIMINDLNQILNRIKQWQNI